MALAALGMSAQQRNDKLLNRPYADLRPWHLGFSIGVHTLDINLTHNGYVTPSGEEWQMEQPSFSPGFCVNGLFSYRLNQWFSLRLSPGMWFGNRVIKMRDAVSGDVTQQNIKSNHVVVPFDVKFAGERYRNSRPYLTAGVMASFDVAKRTARDPLHLKSSDFMLTCGFGCDFYLEYFKLCPEIKFCFGLSDVLRHDRPDFEDDPDGMKFTNSLRKATTNMVVLSFYFE